MKKAYIVCTGFEGDDGTQHITGIVAAFSTERDASNFTTHMQEVGNLSIGTYFFKVVPGFNDEKGMMHND